MVIVIAVFEENVVLGRDLIVNLNSIDEKRKIIKTVNASLSSERS